MRGCRVVGEERGRSGGRGPGLDVSPWEQGTALPGGFDRARFHGEWGGSGREEVSARAVARRISLAKRIKEAARLRLLDGRVASFTTLL